MFGKNEDVEVWYQYPTVHWIYDRLQLCERLGYQCGPAATKPSNRGQWFIKPQINLAGMGLGAQMYTGQIIPPGYFWMPYFQGQHLSIDLLFINATWKVREVLTVEYENDRPKLWTRLARSDSYCAIVPSWLFAALQAANVTQFNVECIDNNIIEAHLRWGHDFDAAPSDTKYAEVVWADCTDKQPYVKDFEDCLGQLSVPRLGFRYF